MNVTISVLGPELTLKQDMALEPESPTLKDVAKALLEQDRAKWEHILKDNLPPTESYAVLINGKNIQSLEGLETKIREGDDIVFAVLISGG
jgi:molybdopterin converting factor small subunit